MGGDLYDALLGDPLDKTSEKAKEGKVFPEERTAGIEKPMEGYV